MGSHTPVARCMATFNMQAGDYNGCDFQGLKMSGTDFSKASGVGATFSFATLLGFQARESNLRGAMFERTEAQKSKFDFADMSDSMLGANFRDASMEGVTLTNAKLADAHLDGAASFRNADMTGADLRGARFTSASFEGRARAILFEADVTGASFKDADVTGTVWGFVTGFDTVDFTGAKGAPSPDAVACTQKAAPCNPFG
ncbi:hypothetical protein EMIHUDRAFT_447522 [Emiliania huxleyi CCMP1516]|uniref:Pentapeptide repeat-containing protein n=2 Tax=Emiliania huxleyi TaxID=2903 RepID=A0A0D3L1Q0_EMIH1|nr:hypothetical protein EMIHUDRAFT_447522 [Emiliania huxleyi CCMP1516]EOD41935.1 hypothetical protein EMIHUDRAFT_447522 [Emiliania huxleyi CCMP1516]|eukprot:XP_005794364.1 hypothetical protein EMIHUDRAFT_447522 [Emiliania huxleyi CCMP1516]